MKFPFIEYISVNDSPNLNLYITKREYEYVIEKWKNGIQTTEFLGYYLRRERDWFEKTSDHLILLYWMKKINQNHYEEINK